jgi:hypothetical protein
MQGTDENKYLLQLTGSLQKSLSLNEIENSHDENMDYNANENVLMHSTPIHEESVNENKAKKQKLFHELSLSPICKLLY